MNIVIPPDAYRRMPWKNGGGTTALIATSGDEPAGWRLSRAIVASDNPFSDFAGYERFIVLLEGEGCLLTVRGKLVMLDDWLVPFRFAGEDPVDCALVDGPCVDLNWMVRRDRFEGRVTVLRPGESADAVAVYAAGDALVNAGESVEIPAGHTLVGARQPVQLDLGGPVIACDARPLLR
ncbi:MAG: HutD family protein [Deltaproteobacteria bacterium]|nr:HutD family protein [Deltaproteobacteria bacterium]MBM4392146.1 HutD family protein [Deltaproteobacteria bacterium]